MGNLQALGVQELTVEDQRALVGGEGWIARVFGWLVGGIGGGAMNIVEVTVDAASDFAHGFAAGYAEARG